MTTSTFIITVCVIKREYINGILCQTVVFIAQIPFETSIANYLRTKFSNNNDDINNINDISVANNSNNDNINNSNVNINGSNINNINIHDNHNHSIRVSNIDSTNNMNSNNSNNNNINIPNSNHIERTFYEIHNGDISHYHNVLNTLAAITSYYCFRTSVEQANIIHYCRFICCCDHCVNLC